MFASMKGILEGYGATQEHGFFHLITETPCVSSTHIVSYHLINAINSDKNVVFLALQNSWTHYCEIANKFGINLRSPKYQDNISVLNSFKHLSDLIEGETENIFSFVDNDHSFKTFALYVRDMLQRFKDRQRPVVLIIDSLTPLLYLGVEEIEIKCLIRLCCNVLSENEDRVVVVCTEGDYLSDSLLSHCRREASICLSVRGLSTGISQNVFGEMTIYTNSETFEYSGVRTSSNHRYKIESRDVILFPVR